MAETAPSPGRRQVVTWLLGTSVGALLASILYPVLRFVSPPPVPDAATGEVEAGVANDPDYLEKGYKIVRFGNEPVIVIRVSEQEFRAFTATCTHLACVVGFRKKQSLIWCNCHNGRFDLTGRNVGGPPPRPLTAFAVHLVSGGAGKPATVVVSRS